jgi:hypothetical protein
MTYSQLSIVCKGMGTVEMATLEDNLQILYEVILLKLRRMFQE